MDATVEEIRCHIREVPDFPQRGISFKDITPLIEDGPAFHAAVDRMARAAEGVRRPDKLPRETISAAYELEYGQSSLRIHTDSIPEGARVLVVDDLLATGGTARAMCQLVENAGGRRLI